MCYYTNKYIIIYIHNMENYKSRSCNGDIYICHYKITLRPQMLGIIFEYM